MARNCAKKPHQNSTSTRLRKQSSSRPAKVRTSARLATRPRSASPPPACGHLEQTAHLPTKPTAAPAAPQAQPPANPRKPRLTVKSPARHKAAPPIFTAHKAPRPAKSPRPSRSTSPTQPPQPRERPLTPHSASAANQPPPNSQSPCAALPTATPPNLLATAQPTTFTTSKSFALAASAFSFRLQRASSSAPCPTSASAARRVFPEALLATHLCPKPSPVAHGEAVSAARGVRPCCHPTWWLIHLTASLGFQIPPIQSSRLL